MSARRRNAAPPPELRLVPPGCCPTCGQRLPNAPRRECGNCGRPILKGHKFTFQGSTVVHRHCDAPDAYTVETKERGA